MFQLEAIHDGIFKLGQVIEPAEVLAEVIPRLEPDLDWSGGPKWAPRDTAWYGDEGCHYTYSNTKNDPMPWTTELQRLKSLVEKASGHEFNSVLINRYSDGNNSVAWHSDDEPELGTNPVIASLSLGQVRRFEIKHKRDKTEWNIPLESGSLLIMAGESQHNWLHRVPKERHITGARLNLTFRKIR